MTSAPGSTLSAGSAAAGRAQLAPAEVRMAEDLVMRALRPRGLPYYSPEERLVLAILVANMRLQQRARGKKSKGAAKQRAEYRRNHVNALLRYVVEKRYRKDPHSLATIMKMIEWLDHIGIEASESQVRRDIHEALKSGPLLEW